MSEMALFRITEDDLRRFEEKQANSIPINHPLRDTATTTFFQAMMSDEADFVQQNTVTAEGVKLLRPDE